MNKYVFLLACFIISAGASCQQSTDNLSELSWLVGNWERTNGKPGSASFETWEKISAKELGGTGVIMKGSDTVFVEKLRIVLANGQVNYIADVPENKSVVYFPFTSLDENGFVCENLEHDFPKKIAYSRDMNSLTAIISGNGKSITYTFKRAVNR
jgi:hypothetical protein